jgi:hypothetical protein
MFAGSNLTHVPTRKMGWFRVLAENRQSRDAQQIRELLCCALPPFQIISTLWIALFPPIDENPVRPDAAICGEHDGAVTETLGSLDALGDVDFAVHRETFLTCGISLGIATR